MPELPLRADFDPLTPHGTDHAQHHNDLAYFINNGGGGGGGGGGLLDAVKVNDPTATATYTITTNAALTAVDATNLKVSFVAPASGEVLLTWSAHLGGPNAYVGWASSATPTVIEQGSYTYFDTTIDTNRYSGETLLTGLTPGNTYEYVLVWRLAFGSGTLTMYHGVGGYGPIVLTAQSVGSSGSSSGSYPAGSTYTAVQRTTDASAVTTTSYGNAGLSDLVIGAAAGDVLLIGAHYIVGSPAYQMNANVATVVGGSASNYVYGATGMPGLRVEANEVSANNPGKHAIHHYTVQAGDVVNGQVTLRLMSKSGTAGQGRGILGNAGHPATLWARNLTAESGGGSGGGVGFIGHMTGTLTVTTGTARMYNITGHTLTISGIIATVGTAPTGASILVDVNKNGTTIFTTQANRPAILAGTLSSGKITNMNVVTLADGDYLTVDVDQIGSTVAGSNLQVQIAVS